MEDIGVLNQILSGDCQIIPLSYTSQFGFVFNMIHPNNTEILKIYILANIENIQNQEVGKKKQKKMSIDDKYFELPNYIDLASMNIKVGPFDDEPGYGKRAESRENFIREATIQNEVYNTSINNGRLCPEIYGSYIVDNNRASAFLELLKTKCREQLEGENMIKYLQNNLHRYDLGIIRMEYAEGYITFREAPENQTLYENVIYANIRLLIENGYMHLDLNPGNVMVRVDEVLLIDFGKTKDIIEIIQTFGKKNGEDFERIREIVSKPDLTVTDIETIIDFIIKCEEDYLYDLDVLNRRNEGLFYINFVNKLSDSTSSYQKIAKNLNDRKNKTISPKYGELLQILQILQNTAVRSNSSQTNHVFGFIGSESPPSNKIGSLFGSESSPSSPESPQNTAVSSNSSQTKHVFGLFGSESPLSNNRGSLFGSESPPPNKSPPKRRGDGLFEYESPPKRRGDGLFEYESPPKRTEIFRDPDSENSDPNIFSFYNNLPRTPVGGAKKSKKQKRKPLHNKRRSKTRKNKSNKKRVKLISNK
jgi:hypothetical protein